MKVLFGVALRQTTGFVESLLRLTGLDWLVPDFTTTCIHLGIVQLCSLLGSPSNLFAYA